MTPIDDIKDDGIEGGAPASQSSGLPKAPGPRSVGPESETRGGPEAPDESLADDPIGKSP